MSDSEFWALTPRLFAALLERHQAATERADWRAALVSAQVHNAVGSIFGLQKPYQPSDFLPKKAAEQQTPEQMLATAELICAAFSQAQQGQK